MKTFIIGYIRGGHKIEKQIKAETFTIGNGAAYFYIQVEGINRMVAAVMDYEYIGEEMHIYDLNRV